MVWKRRSTAAGLQLAELVGVDWELPSSIGLTRRSRKPRRSSGAPWHGSGWLQSTATGTAGARVSVTARNLGEEEELRLLGLIHCGGATFIDHGGRRPSSGASTKRRRIGRLQKLHRAASQLEVEDDRNGMVAWAGFDRGLGVGPAQLGFGLVAVARFLSLLYFFLFLFSIFISNSDLLI
jgi:hypothetical protein